MKYELIIFRNLIGDYDKFKKKLRLETRARLSTDLERLISLGKLTPMPYSKKQKTNLWELRLNGEEKVRLIYTIFGNQIYLLDWFLKKTNKTPRKELEKATRRLKLI